MRTSSFPLFSSVFLLTLVLACAGCQSPAASHDGHSMPLVISEEIMGKDDQRVDAQGKPTGIALKNRFEATVPSRILEQVERESGQKVSPVAVLLCGFRAHRLNPVFEGISSLKNDAIDYTYSILTHSSEPTATGSDNLVTVRLQVGDASYDIRLRCLVNRLRGTDHYDEMGGTATWTGPVRVK